MSNLKMSFGNAIFTALHCVLYVTGITGTICGYVEHTAYGLADVADMHPYELAILSCNPEWHRSGMQLFAFSHTGFYWLRRTLSWDIYNESINMTEDEIAAVIEAAFGKWSAVIPFDFVRATSEQMPDIMFEFDSELPFRVRSSTTFPTPESKILDDQGAIITFNDRTNWTDTNRRYWCNFRFVVLYEIGHALGLGDSTKVRSLMSDKHRGITRPEEPILRPDDIEGVRELYGARNPPSLQQPDPSPPAQLPHNPSS